MRGVQWLLCVLAAAGGVFATAVDSRGETATAGPGGVIAFIRNSEFGEVYLMNADGKNQRQLTPSSARVHRDSAPTWSPSGNRIVFRRQLSGFDRNGERREALYAIDSDGSHLRQLTQPTADLLGLPAWSPDGRSIAIDFVRLQRGALVSAIDVVKADGSGKRRFATGTNSMLRHARRPGRRTGTGSPSRPVGTRAQTPSSPQRSMGATAVRWRPGRAWGICPGHRTAGGSPTRMRPRAAPATPRSMSSTRTEAVARSSPATPPTTASTSGRRTGGNSPTSTEQANPPTTSTRSEPTGNDGSD